MPYRIPMITRFLSAYRKLKPRDGFEFLSVILCDHRPCDIPTMSKPWTELAVIWNELTAWERGNALSELHRDVVEPLRDFESQLWALARKQEVLP